MGVPDVPELGNWMSEAMEGHPLFERVPLDELKKDIVYPLLTEASEEGKKVCLKMFADSGPT